MKKTVSKKIIKVAIRDDDTCFYTKKEDLVNVFNHFDIPFTIGVIPFGVGKHINSYPYGTQDDYSPRAVCDNKELLEYLVDLKNKQNVEIAIHGHDHNYIIGKNGKEISYLLHYDTRRLTNIIANDKLLFEKIFGTSISLFIPPSNSLNKKTIKAIENNGLNLCGLIYLFNRKIDLYYVKNIVKRWYSRILYKVPICGVLKYKNHKELWSFKMFSYNQMVRLFNKAKKAKKDISFCTHYWELRDNKFLLDDLVKFVDYVKQNGGCFSTISDIMETN